MIEAGNAFSYLGSSLVAVVTTANFVSALQNTPEDVRACAQLVTRVYNDLNFLVTLQNSSHHYLENSPVERQRLIGIVTEASESLVAIGSKLESCRAELNGGKLQFMDRMRWVVNDSTSFELHSRNLAVQQASINSEIIWLRGLRKGSTPLEEPEKDIGDDNIFENLELLKMTSRRSTGNASNSRSPAPPAYQEPASQRPEICRDTSGAQRHSVAMPDVPSQGDGLEHRARTMSDSQTMFRELMFGKSPNQPLPYRQNTLPNVEGHSQDRCQSMYDGRDHWRVSTHSNADTRSAQSTFDATDEARRWHTSSNFSSSSNHLPYPSHQQQSTPLPSPSPSTKHPNVYDSPQQRGSRGQEHQTELQPDYHQSKPRQAIGISQEVSANPSHPTSSRFSPPISPPMSPRNTLPSLLRSGPNTPPGTASIPADSSTQSQDYARLHPWSPASDISYQVPFMPPGRPTAPPLIKKGITISDDKIPVEYTPFSYKPKTSSQDDQPRPSTLHSLSENDVPQAVELPLTSPMPEYKQRRTTVIPTVSEQREKIPSPMSQTMSELQSNNASDESDYSTLEVAPLLHNRSPPKHTPPQDHTRPSYYNSPPIHTTPSIQNLHTAQGARLAARLGATTVQSPRNHPIAPPPKPIHHNRNPYNYAQNYKHPSSASASVSTLSLVPTSPTREAPSPPPSRPTPNADYRNNYNHHQNQDQTLHASVSALSLVPTSPETPPRPTSSSTATLASTSTPRYNQYNNNQNNNSKFNHTYNQNFNRLSTSVSALNLVPPQSPPPPPPSQTKPTNQGQLDRRLSGRTLTNYSSLGDVEEEDPQEAFFRDLKLQEEEKRRRIDARRAG